MGIFGKKDYETDNFNDYFNEPKSAAPAPGKIQADVNHDYQKPTPSVAYREKSDPIHSILKLGDKGITQIAAINKIAKENGWVYSVEFPGNKVDMYFEGENYKIFCRGVDYSDEDHIPTGVLLASMIKKNTASYDQHKYIYEKEQNMIASTQKMITEDDIKKLRIEAAEIRKNLDGLINGLEKIDPKPAVKNIPAEEFGKKHKTPENTNEHAAPKIKLVTPSEKSKTPNLDETQKIEPLKNLPKSE